MNFFPDPVKPPLSGEADRGLLRRFCQNRDEAAFTELVRRYAPLVRSVAYRRTGDAQLAEDAAQQTFIVLARKADQVKSVPCLAAWLHRAALYEAAALQRREGRHQRRKTIAHELAGPGGDPPFPPQEGNADVLRRLDESLAALGETDRSLLVLHYLENIGYDQIAVRLGLSPAAAQRRGHRALEKLSRQVRGGGGAASISTGIMLAGLIRPDFAKAASAPLARQSLHSASAVSAGGAVTAAVVAFLSTPLAWTGATVVFAGAAVWSMSTMKSGPGRVTSLSSGGPLSYHGNPADPFTQPPFRPRTPDEELTPEEREFIRLAKTDADAAYAWVRSLVKSAGPMGQNLAISLANRARALADRDLEAADRFLEVMDFSDSRRAVFRELLESRAARDLKSALTWADAYLKTASIERIGYILNLNISDPALLDNVEHPALRKLLINDLMRNMEQADESGLDKLADKLEGKEGQQAMERKLNLLFQRSDPQALVLLDEIQPEELGGEYEIALSFPGPVLDWIRARPQGKRQQKAYMIWYYWTKCDAASAAQWYAALNTEERLTLERKFSVRSDINPTFQRVLRSQPQP